MSGTPGGRVGRKKKKQKKKKIQLSLYVNGIAYKFGKSTLQKEIYSVVKLINQSMNIITMRPSNMFRKLKISLKMNLVLTISQLQKVT